jgi:hypothetical protein
MTEAQCRVATCLRGGNYTERKERFKLLLNQDFWKASVKPQGNAGQTYIPMLRTRHGIGSVFPQDVATGSMHVSSTPTTAKRTYNIYSIIYVVIGVVVTVLSSR